MGMFDTMFNEGAPEYTTGDMLKPYIPVIGPLLAGKGIQKKKRQAQDKWLSDNLAYTDPSELDETGQRVQQRMLQRTGGELSTPGLMAATAMQREAANPANMGNMGNILMQTAGNLAKGGQTAPAATLAQIAHKSFQTPWKPSEGGADIENFKLPDGSVVAAESVEQKRALIRGGAKKAGVASGDDEIPYTVKTGAELGFRIPGIAGDLFKIKYNKDGTIKDISSLSGMSVNVGGTSIVQPGDTSAAVREYQGVLSSTEQAIGVIDNLTEVLDRNPEGGVSGMSGAVTNFISSVSNLAQFAISVDDKKVGEKYEDGFRKFASKYFPTADAALAQAQIVELGYALARVNNMGTSGGGRGITDADMQNALKQLGQMATVEDFKGVLSYQRNKMLQNAEVSRAGTEAVISIAGRDPSLLAPLTTIHDKLKTSKERPKVGKGSAPKEAEDEVRKNPALKQQFFQKFGYYPDGV